MKILKVKWEVRHEDEIWTDEEAPQVRIGEYVATCENPDYPENSSLAQYIVNLHNKEIQE